MNGILATYLINCTFCFHCELIKFRFGRRPWHAFDFAIIVCVSMHVLYLSLSLALSRYIYINMHVHNICIYAFCLFNSLFFFFEAQCKICIYVFDRNMYICMGEPLCKITERKQS